MGVLHLIPIYCGTSGDLLAPLAVHLRDVLGLKIELHPPSFDPELAFDLSRGQYNSRTLLAQLLRNSPKGATRILGVAGVDLFVPVLTYVFGEAQLDGRAAVVSTCRLDCQLYGLPPNRNLLDERLRKEAIHELGHTCGLLHCHQHPCVMMSSTYVEGIDLKSDRFCPRCHERFTKAASHFAASEPG
ncbi:MAG: archaemetzincin family Zn-dependent metalloprotease [Planctomycetota bacterium]